jgi:hypothetical protein
MPEFKSTAEHILFTTLRISTVAAGGARGVGTSFFYSVEKGGKTALFLVTNKHVVKGASSGDLLFTLKNESGQPDLERKYALTVTDFESLWRGHPNPDVDVTVAPLVPLFEQLNQKGISPYYRSIGESLVPSGEVLENLDALEECVFVGYPNDIWDSRHNLPVARRGITATHPAVDFKGDPVFLLDASVFPGSSGSPVLILNRGAFPVSKGGGMTVGTRVVLLGVIASVFFREQKGRIESRPIPTVADDQLVTQEMLDLGIVFKARTIRETINHHFPNMFGE